MKAETEISVCLIKGYGGEWEGRRLGRGVRRRRE